MYNTCTGWFIECVKLQRGEEMRTLRQAGRERTDLQAICLHALGMAHSMTVKAQAAKVEKRQR